MDDAKLLSRDDLHLFNEGRHFRLYERLGAHVTGNRGTQFAVWAPNARSVSVIGDFNGWDKNRHHLQPLGESGVWAGEVAEAGPGQAYKYHVISQHRGHPADKADPFAFCTETPPRTASVIHKLSHDWGDAEWMRRRSETQALNKPMSVYEVHLGSWRRHAGDYSRSLSYAELADTLIPYVLDMGYTHVELMPVMEHPFGGSWGYQVTGYFAPSRRYGDPEQLMMLIDRFHQAGIGVILDWVPSHFPTDAHGLQFFDGTHLYEHADPRQGFHPDWNSSIFNYGRNEVRSFLISSACFWFDKYHIDALRVDAVASLLYLDYSRKEGEWVPNIYGGRENLEAIRFLRDLNEEVYGRFPGIQMIAEESTAFPGVTRPVFLGGLGFGLKWDMGWMHDTLRYFGRDPVHRRHHQDDMTFRTLYAFQENYVLALSHDEVVHGKRSLIARMPGDEWRKFANLRCLYSYMYATPGKKLMFMGGEFAQGSEWNHNTGLDWHLAAQSPNADTRRLVRDLNALYRREAALHYDCDAKGFEWVDGADSENSVIAFLRRTPDGSSKILCVFNFTPMPREGYHIGVPSPGRWKEVLNSDAADYGGTGRANGTPEARAGVTHGHPFYLRLTLPPLGALFLKWMP